MRKLFVLTVFIAALTGTIQAQDRLAVEQGQLAFDGYDLVGYFDGKVLKGSPDLEYTYQGIKLRFSSQDNLDLFKSNPAAYFPAYGGWCAIAMVQNSFVIPDYTLYKIQEDQLLFFQVKAFFNGLTYWNKDPDKNLFLADSNYRKHFDE